MVIKHFKRSRSTNSWFGYPIMIVILFSMMLVGSLLYLWRGSRIIGDIIIAQEVVQLHEIFKKIDDTCGIIGFEHQRNYIDFLTVKAFVSSEVGAMNLANPGNWAGPYVQDNPTVQEKLYEIVCIKKGCYIVPGEGVKLSNGKVIGIDIVFDKDADVEAMMAEGQALNFKGQALAAKLELKLLSGSRGVEETVLQQADEGE